LIKPSLGRGVVLDMSVYALQFAISTYDYMISYFKKQCLVCLLLRCFSFKCSFPHLLNDFILFQACWTNLPSFEVVLVVGVQVQQVLRVRQLWTLYYVRFSSSTSQHKSNFLWMPKSKVKFFKYFCVVLLHSLTFKLILLKYSYKVNLLFSQFMYRYSFCMTF